MKNAYLETGHRRMEAALDIGLIQRVISWKY